MILAVIFFKDVLASVKKNPFYSKFAERYRNRYWFYQVLFLKCFIQGLFMFCFCLFSVYLYDELHDNNCKLGCFSLQFYQLLLYLFDVLLLGAYPFEFLCLLEEFEHFIIYPWQYFLLIHLF